MIGIIDSLAQMMRYTFMQNAFLSATMIAVSASMVGYFMTLRGQSFAGHTLAQAGFAGASGAALLNLPPLTGLIGMGIVAALGIGYLQQRRIQQTDVIIGTILAFSLGLGLLFTSLNPTFANSITATLFGEIVGVTSNNVISTLGMSIITVVIIILLWRPLYFASVDPNVAEARGIPVRFLSFIFLILMSIAVAQAVQVVGILLIISLLVTPSAIAQIVTNHPRRSFLLSIGLALFFVWTGLILAYFLPYPAGFFISTLAFIAYECAQLFRRQHIQYQHSHDERSAA